MKANVTKTNDAAKEARIREIMETLRKPTAPKTVVSDFIVDRVSDSSEFAARIGAGLVTAYDNGLDAYSLERERQLKRRAEKLYAAAEALAA